jgi:hypothetical protein
VGAKVSENDSLAHSEGRRATTSILSSKDPEIQEKTKLVEVIQKRLRNTFALNLVRIFDARDSLINKHFRLNEGTAGALAGGGEIEQHQQPHMAVLLQREAELEKNLNELASEKRHVEALVNVAFDAFQAITLGSASQELVGEKDYWDFLRAEGRLVEKSESVPDEGSDADEEVGGDA